MKYYNIRKDKRRERRAMAVQDEVTIRQALFPFWLFSNPRPDLGEGAFFCFIGCNYPNGIQTKDEKEWRGALKYMQTTFVSDQKRVANNEKKRIAWGSGDIPADAFKAAMKASAAPPQVISG